MTTAHRAACNKMLRAAARVRTSKLPDARPGAIRVPPRRPDEEQTQPIPYESLADVARAWRDQMSKEST